MRASSGGGVDPKIHAPGDATVGDAVKSIDTRLDDSPFGWAQRLAALGYRLHPLRPGTKKPMPEWPRLATSNPAQLARWHQLHPRANWGLLTGQGVGVIDVDNKHGLHGDESWGALVEQLSCAALMPRVATPNNGAHAYFRYDGELRQRIAWRAGIDLLGDNVRFVVAPGSVLGRNGDEGRYRVVHGDLARLPLITRDDLSLLNAPSTRSSSDGSHAGQNAPGALPETDYLRAHGFAAGERDLGFHRLAWRLWRYHWPHEELVRSVMHEVWLSTAQPADDLYPWSQVENKIARAKASLAPRIVEEQRWIEQLRGGGR